MSLTAGSNWFTGKTALVTGAASGMGQEIALELGRRGARVGVNYRSSRAEAEVLCGRIESLGGSAIALQADVSQPRDVEKLFEAFEQAFGLNVDMLVNNAGQWMDKSPIQQCAVETWDRVFEINARSVFLCCQQAVKRMAVVRSGSIVNIGSLAGHTGGGGGTVPYAAAKAAVHTFTRGLAREMAPLGIRVNAIAPGMVDTPMLEGRVTDQAASQIKAATPLGRFAEASEMAPAVLFLLSPAASFITGQIIEINGGLLMR